MQPIHQFGDAVPLNWPAGVARVYRVEGPNGRYLATYALRRDAEDHARRVSRGAWRDAAVIPIDRVRS